MLYVVGPTFILFVRWSKLILIDDQLGRWRKLGWVVEALRAGFQTAAIIGRSALLVSVSAGNQSRKFREGIAFSGALGTLSNHRICSGSV
jgi:hypothetical protein